jgi:hypothetical protein
MPKANPAQTEPERPNIGSAPSKIDDDVALGSAAADQRIAVGRRLDGIALVALWIVRTVMGRGSRG